MGEHAASVPGWEGSYASIREPVSAERVAHRPQGHEGVEVLGGDWNYYWKSTHLPELRDDLIAVIAEHAFSCSSPRSYVAMFHLKGAVSRVSEGVTAFGNRHAFHAITLDSVWRPGEDFGDRDTAWTRTFFAALGRFREGVYVNFLGDDEDPRPGSARHTATPSTTGWWT